MTSDDCTSERVGRDGAGDRRVRDAMLRSPKTVPADGSVADLRRLFANTHVMTALLVDGTRFAGAVERDELPADAPDEAPARDMARRDVGTVEPDTPLPIALSRLDQEAARRLIVLDPDGRTLRGLLCLTRDRNGFCQGTPTTAG